MESQMAVHGASGDNGRGRSGTAVIVGGSSGVGAATAVALGESYSRVVINFRTSDSEAAAVAERVRRAGASVSLVRADIATKSGRFQVVEAIASEGMAVDALIYLAVLPLAGSALKTSMEDMRKSIEVSALSFLWLVREAADLLSDSCGIVYVSSHGARLTVPGYAPIGIAKATGEAVVRYLAAELGRRGVRVNAVCPGPLSTSSFHDVFGEHGDRILESASKRDFSDQELSVESIAETIRGVVSSDFQGVQGQVIVADNGLSISV